MNNMSKKQVVSSIVKDVEESFSDEETIHYILEKQLSVKPDDKSESFGQRTADAFARFAGSWVFIIGFSVCLIGWIIVNVLLLSGAFDPYPFILLNLVLSCVAALQAPLIMMSQNRQEQKDRIRSENDYKVNLKNELIIQDLHQKLDQILINQKLLLKNQNETAEK